MRTKIRFNGYSVKFSPFIDGRLAIATAQNFGIIGNGRLHVSQLHGPDAPEVCGYDTLDGIYDCAWSEENENVVAAACGDGSIKVYDCAAPPAANPLRSLNEHKHECCSLSWNTSKRDLFLSSSWDDTAKLWTLNAPTSLATFTGHTYCVYQVAWNVHQPDVFLTASGDTTVRIWDVRQPGPRLVLPAGAGFEVLSADWCKYNDCLIATGGVDKAVRVWDVRVPTREVAVMGGHTYAVRRVVYSPHSEFLIASCSYDMTVRLWDVRRAADGQAQMALWDHHTEFVVGLDWSVLQEGLLASAGWDETVCVWHMTGAP